MTRLEENGMIIDEIAKGVKRNQSGTYEETVTFQLAVIATMLTDISQSLAILADKAEKEEPQIGHWIEEDMFDGDVAYRCSECNELFWIESGTPKDNEYNFCPKCGKRLVEPQERSDE